MPATPDPRNPRYEPHETPPILVSLGLGAQHTAIAAPGILIAPVIVAEASGIGESYLAWMVFATLVIVGVSTIVQLIQFGPIGTGVVHTIYTSYITIPFSIIALASGGPATLMTLVLVSAVFQIAISKWLFILRRIVTPTVSNTVMMLVALNMAAIIFLVLDEPVAARPVPTLTTVSVSTVVLVILTFRGPDVLRPWVPLLGIVAGCVTAAAFGAYDASRVLYAPWIGLPLSDWPPPRLDFGVAFWSLLPAFLLLSVVISFQMNGTAIALQRISWRQARVIDFRRVQGSVMGVGISNLIAGIAGTVPNTSDVSIISFIRMTGAASRSVGYCIGGLFIMIAFLPKLSGLFGAIPGPIIAGYLIVTVGITFAEGLRGIAHSGFDRDKVMVAGISFLIGAVFEFKLSPLPPFDPVWGGVFSSGVTAGGLAATVMSAFIEYTTQRRMRFQSKLGAEALPELNAFIGRFVERKGWNADMRYRLNAVAEETLLTLAPPDEDESNGNKQQLVVLASSDGPVAQLEFIGAAGGEDNLEDRLSQLREYDLEPPAEHEVSLRLLQHYASTVRHQQYHETDIVVVRVEQPGM